MAAGQPETDAAQRSPQGNGCVRLSYSQQFMVATYSLQRITSTPGKVEARVASHVWGPDIGSNLEARSGWQAAGGLGGLLMTLYPSSASGVPNLPNFVVQGPIMDHMGNVTSVLRMDSSAGLRHLSIKNRFHYSGYLHV